MYDNIREALDKAYEKLRYVYINTSVLGPVREYSCDVVNKEIWAFLCAMVDFQVSVRKHLNPMLRGLRVTLEENNLSLLKLAEDYQLARRLLSSFRWYGLDKVGFSHRFIRIDDIISLLKALRRIVIKYGSLGSLARKLAKTMPNDFPEPAEYLIRKLLACIHREAAGKISTRIVPSPLSRSPLKRLNLFLRWMVRPDPDLGLWRDVLDKKHLLISLDSGVARVLNRITGRRIVGLNPRWKDVIRVTKLLRLMNPEDPAKYDYVLSRPSIMGYCTKDFRARMCFLCILRDICRSAKLAYDRKIPVKMFSRKEHAILRNFLGRYREHLHIDKYYVEYPIGRRRIDLIFHTEHCTWWVAEVEHTLNYQAIGQVVVYRNLYLRKFGIHPRGVIICTKASPEMREVCEVDAGIDVFLVEQG